MAQWFAYCTHLTSKSFGCYLVSVGQLTGSVYYFLIVQLINLKLQFGNASTSTMDCACIYHQGVPYHTQTRTVWLGSFNVISLLKLSDPTKSYA